MGGTLQHHWVHDLPKSKEPVGARINLTSPLLPRRLISHPEDQRTQMNTALPPHLPMNTRPCPFFWGGWFGKICVHWEVWREVCVHLWVSAPVVA